MHKQNNSIDSLFISVAKLHYSRAQDLFNKLGLHRGQPPILFVLWEQDGRTQREISERLMSTPATVTVILQRMEKSGFIIRKPDRHDLRVSRVYLTDKGKEIRSAVEDTLKDLEAQTFANFNTEELALIRRFFIQIKENLLKPGGTA